MRNSSIYRSNLSDEKIAFLSEIKNQKENNEDENTPKAYKRPAKQKELDILWESFKISAKEEKSPGVYLLTGFVAGALCIFLMNSIISVSSNLSGNSGGSTLGQPKYEKKISRKTALSQMTAQRDMIPAVNTAAIATTSSEQVSKVPEFEIYTVKSGDSMSTIVNRFYGRYDVEKIERIKQINNLSSAHKLSIGQKLNIPLD